MKRFPARVQTTDYRLLASELLRALRGGESAAAVSRFLGYKTNVVSQWERGRGAPTAAVTFRLARAMGVDVQNVVARLLTVESAGRTCSIDPTSTLGVAELLRELEGRTTTLGLAAKANLSPAVLSQWIEGTAEPRLPHFLSVIESATSRLSAFIEGLVGELALAASDANPAESRVGGAKSNNLVFLHRPSEGRSESDVQVGDERDNNAPLDQIQAVCRVSSRNLERLREAQAAYVAGLQDLARRTGPIEHIVLVTVGIQDLSEPIENP